MSVAALPDLNPLSAEALRALILTQHEQLISREREIDHLKLLLFKLHRMQFGRKSEKLAQQIEQLELRLEELESNRGEKEKPSSSKPPAAAASSKPLRKISETVSNVMAVLTRQERRLLNQRRLCPRRSFRSGC